MITVQKPYRWYNYFMKKNDGFLKFWENYFSVNDTPLYILGHGFDPRMCDCLETILALNQKNKSFETLILKYDEGEQSSSQLYKDQRNNNEKKLFNICKNRGKITEKVIEMFSDDGRRIGARSIANQFLQISNLLSYSDIIVDISALPLGLYFPLIAKLLALLDQIHIKQNVPNLHIVVSHSSEYDSNIIDEGIDETADYLHGFSAASFELESTKDQPRIWIPILGKGQNIKIERINDLIKPDEICPLLPSPARNPRESDDLILEYRELLFDVLHVEPQNFIYASETNPFEVYRQIIRTILHYNKVLKPLGGCKAVVSSMSSKLLSLGALLAAYELAQWRTGENRIDVGIGHIDTQGYTILSTIPLGKKPEYYTIMLPRHY